jgi:hypothetical protein
MPTDKSELIPSDARIDTLLKALDAYVCSLDETFGLSQGGKYVVELRMIVRQWLEGKDVADRR